MNQRNILSSYIQGKNEDPEDFLEKPEDTEDPKDVSEESMPECYKQKPFMVLRKNLKIF